MKKYLVFAAMIVLALCSGAWAGYYDEGHYAINASLADGTEGTSYSGLDITTGGKDLYIITVSLVSGQVGEDYCQILEASPAEEYTPLEDIVYSVSWSITKGTLPDGLSLNGDTGEISGKPTTAGVYAFTATAYSGGQTDSEELSITIAEASQAEGLTITNSSEIIAYYYCDYIYGDYLYSKPEVSRTVFQAELSGEPVSAYWSVTSGDIPEGFTLLSATGEFAGRPTKFWYGRDSTFTLTASYNGFTVSKQFTIKFRGHSSNEYGGGEVIPEYDVITGDGYVYLMYIATALLPDGHTGKSYSYTLIASPFEEWHDWDLDDWDRDYTNFSWSITAGSLPPGLSLNSSTGEISGTPTTAGKYTFTVQVSDGIHTDTEELSITIAEPEGTITESDLVITNSSEIIAYYYCDYIIGDNDDYYLYSKPEVSRTVFQAELSGEPVSAYWSVTSGDIPEGFTLISATGEFAGRPTKFWYDRKSTFTLTASYNGFTVSKQFTIDFRDHSSNENEDGDGDGEVITGDGYVYLMYIATALLPDGHTGESYSHTLIASPFEEWHDWDLDDWDQDYTTFSWSITAGSLPPGLSLNSSTGEISGTPTVAGKYTFTVQAKVYGDTDTEELSITIDEAEGTSVRPRYKSINLILSGQIGMNFFLDLPEIQGVDYYDGETCWMDFDINGDSTSNPPQLVDDEFMSNGRHGFRCYVNSVQMADSIDATFHYGNNKTASYTYTIEKYLNSKLKGSGLMRDLAAAIKDYGHYAQIYLSQANGWKLGVDHIAMDAVNTYTNADIENVKQISQQYKIVKDKYAGTCVKGASYNLSLASETTINLTLTMADECTGSSVFASLNGGTENMAVRQPNGKYTVEISGIPAHLLAEPQTITVTADGAEDFTIQVAALTFTYNTLNSTSASQAKKNLAVALYKYYEATNNYRNAQ